MPTFRITSPDGAVYHVDAPDGATEQDALAKVQAEHTAVASTRASSDIGLNGGSSTGTKLEIADALNSLPTTDEIQPTQSQTQEPNAPETSAGGAFVRAAGRGALPAAGGLAAAGAGAELGGLGGSALGAMTGPLAPAAVPILGGIGGLAGGLAGYFGGAKAAGYIQDKVLGVLPNSVKELLGQDEAQQQADVKEHPYASMAGELAPNLLLLRPGAVAQVAEDAPRLAKIMGNPVTARAFPAALMGGQEAITEASNGEDLDPTKIAISAGAGALMNKETALGKRVSGAGQYLIPKSLRTPVAPAPEVVADTVMASDSVDVAIASANDIAKTPVETAIPEVAAREAPIAEPVEAPPEVMTKEELQTNKEVIPETAKTEPAPNVDEIARSVDPSTFKEYDNLQAKHETYTRWVQELTDKRDSDPRVAAATAEIDTILKKVKGNEQYLTKSQAARLEDIRGGLQDYLSLDTPDMVKVKTLLSDNYGAMQELAPRVKDAYQKAQERVTPSEPAPQSDAAATPVEPTVDTASNAPEVAPTETAPEPTQPVQSIGVSDTGPVTVREAEPQPSAPLPKPIEPAPSAAMSERQVVKTIRADDLGTRDEKGILHANLAEVGDRVEALSDKALSEGMNVTLYTGGKAIPIVGPRMRDANGMPWGVGSILFGSKAADHRLEISRPAAKPEAAVVPKVEAAPPRQVPIDGERVVTEQPTSQAAVPEQEAAPEPYVRPKPLKAIEGTGELRKRAINDDMYRVGEEKPQIEAAAKLIESDPERAVAIAMREKQSIPGVHPEFVYMAVKDMASKAGDADLLMRLSRSKIAEEATTMGQRSAAWRNRDALDETQAIRSVEEARAAKLKEQGVDVPKEAAKFADASTDQIKAESQRVRKMTPRPTWDKILEELTCKY